MLSSITKASLSLLLASQAVGQSHTGPYGIYDLSKPFNLYAFVGDGPYSIDLVRSSNQTVMRASDYSNDPPPTPTNFTLRELQGQYGFSLLAKHHGKTFSADLPLYNVPVTFHRGTGGDGRFNVHSLYRQPTLRTNDGYIDVRLDTYSNNNPNLCTSIQGGYLVFEYGPDPHPDGSNGGTKKPCYGRDVKYWELRGEGLTVDESTNATPHNG